MMNKAFELGFGGVTTKTITLNPGKGNPHPRMWRYKGGLINKVGLANKGLKCWKKELKKVKYEPVIASIHGNSVKEFDCLYDEVKDLCNLVEFNFSCPNVPGGIYSEDFIEQAVQNKSDYLVKIGVKHNLEKIIEIVDGGITAINTINGMSGQLIYEHNLNALKKIRKKTCIPVISTGGVSTPEQVRELLENGADGIGILTGLITKGPYIIKKLSPHQ
jgi:dihydroorotate dehydrogenase